MATVLDLSVLKAFMPVFSWLFAFLLVYGFLKVTNIFKNDGINALIAFVFSLMVAVSGTATGAISAMAPWFMVIIFFVFIIYLIGSFMGIPTVDMLGTLGGPRGAMWWILIIGFIILAAGLSQSFGQQLLKAREGGNQTATVTGPGSTGSPSIGQNVLLTLTNAKVLGMVVLLLISALTLALMSSPIK